jgi:electron transfer flavoprotein beta subunit
MNIIVLTKVVPDIERVKFDAARGVVDRSSAPQEINPFDLNAIEEAVRLKERHGGRITAISMGPSDVEQTLKDTIARGVDEAILLTDKKFAGSDTLATSYALSQAIKSTGDFDIVICGEKTVDGDTGQVGGEVSEWLGISYLPYTSKLDYEDGKFKARVELEDIIYEVETSPPLLVSVTKDINTPRLPGFREKLNARKTQVKKMDAEGIEADEGRLGFNGSPTWVYKIEVPEEGQRDCKIYKDPESGLKEIMIILESRDLI